MTATLPRRRSRRWIGFFVVLAVLGVAAIVAPLVYNLSIQLRPEQLADARWRWQENAPANYDLECLSEIRRGGQEEKSHYRLQVRGGRVVLVVQDGELVYVDPSLAVVAGSAVLALLEGNPERYGVPVLFDDIEAALRQVTTAERRSYLRADFDKDGHPSHYVHYDPSTKDRVESFVKMSLVP
jgi:hypothetical protein